MKDKWQNFIRRHPLIYSAIVLSLAAGALMLANSVPIPAK